MTLVKYRDYFNHHEDLLGNSELLNIDQFDVYTEGEENIGGIKDALVDEQSGKFRYLVVDTGFWIFGKNVLLPIGLAKFDMSHQRVYVNGLTREQVEQLPEYRSDLVVDYDYEENVRNVYRPLGRSRANEVRQYRGQTYTNQMQPNDAQGYRYEQEPELFDLDAEDHKHPIRLHEERLVANKSRDKVGEVSVKKRVETATAEKSVPVEKERVVVEYSPSGQINNSTSVAPGFQEQEVAHLDLYEETAQIDKQTFVRDEVRIRKEAEQDRVVMRDQVRREELDVEGDAEVINPRSGNSRSGDRL